MDGGGEDKQWLIIRVITSTAAIASCQHFGAAALLPHRWLHNVGPSPPPSGLLEQRRIAGTPYSRGRASCASFRGRRGGANIMQEQKLAVPPPAAPPGLSRKRKAIRDLLEGENTKEKKSSVGTGLLGENHSEGSPLLWKLMALGGSVSNAMEADGSRTITARGLPGRLYLDQRLVLGLLYEFLVEAKDSRMLC
ncbi:hypothetical protein E2562_021054 [Oryza meyeriana var. granulata]|uniref:Uncharacterized protein n=1 Tax=Oryza meyeriana var. granulata TaxID=110450 RepID=A0A6G1FAX1_9ORYZ|nr:hypothetical protein E2562_021054 [Oryza meyeriana var. granulata]